MLAPLLLAALSLTDAPAVAIPPPAIPPTGEDWSLPSLTAYQSALVAAHGGSHRTVPLGVKAEYYEWFVRRYTLSDAGLVHGFAELADVPGVPPTRLTGNDTVTWHGAVLAGMSYRYAVTRDVRTLELIERLLGGAHLAFAVTGSRGLPCRCFIESDEPVGKCTRRYDGPRGRTFYYKSDAAKGTINQLVGGLTVCLLLCGDDLHPEIRRTAKRDLFDLARHLAVHDFRLTERDGGRTEFGNLTPRIGGHGVPFNAQIAYLALAAGHHFMPAGTARADRAVVEDTLHELRNTHHVYWEDPRKTLVRPQRVGASPLVKGMNDRHHVLTAAYHAALLEQFGRDGAGRFAGAKPGDAQFLYRIGRTGVWTMRKLADERNSLCAFLWTGLVDDPHRAAAILPDARDRAEAFGSYRSAVAEGIEHLRRFPLDRRQFKGLSEDTRDRQWVAEVDFRDCYVWKADNRHVIRRLSSENGGGPTDRVTAALDYLHAYWAMRFWRLDEKSGLSEVRGERSLGP